MIQDMFLLALYVGPPHPLHFLLEERKWGTMREHLIQTVENLMLQL